MKHMIKINNQQPDGQEYTSNPNTGVPHLSEKQENQDS